jgi:hypothetical protein
MNSTHIMSIPVDVTLSKLPSERFTMVIDKCSVYIGLNVTGYVF